MCLVRRGTMSYLNRTTKNRSRASKQHRACSQRKRRSAAAGAAKPQRAPRLTRAVTRATIDSAEELDRTTRPPYSLPIDSVRLRGFVRTACFTASAGLPRPQGAPACSPVSSAVSSPSAVKPHAVRRQLSNRPLSAVTRQLSSRQAVSCQAVSCQAVSCQAASRERIQQPEPPCASKRTGSMDGRPLWRT